MSRSDQWYGLNNRAIKFLDEFIKRHDSAVVTTRLLVANDKTLCGNEFYGTVVEYIVEDENAPNSKFIIYEEIQEISWASGPRYFTNLSIYCEKRLSGGLLLLGDGLFSWRRIVSPRFATDIEFLNVDEINGEFQA